MSKSRRAASALTVGTDCAIAAVARRFSAICHTIGLGFAFIVWSSPSTVVSISDAVFSINRASEDIAVMAIAFGSCVLASCNSLRLDRHTRVHTATKRSNADCLFTIGAAPDGSSHRVRKSMTSLTVWLSFSEPALS